ncbi:MAG: choice-of-anchor Q domain-containing protein, partial [Cyclobacteriaceae bacterium]
AFNLNECVFQGNTISTSGDAIRAYGGGIAFSSQNSFNVIRNSSIIQNASEWDGGGISGRGSIELSNTTISGNSSKIGATALILSNGAFDIDFCTITNNHSENSLDEFAVKVLGAANDGDPTPVSITNTIIAGNTSNHLSGYAKDLELTGNFSGVAVHNNLLSATGNYIFPEVNVITADPNDWGLEPLADNGGFTPTHALLPNSLAINAADSTVSGGTDQRGAPRVQDGRADIGAFERTGSLIDTEPPSSPVLKVDSLMETFVKLSWTASSDNVGVIGYDVYQDSTLVGFTDSLEFLVVGLLPCMEYRYTVIARDEADNQTPSNEVTVFTDTTPPEAPVLEDIITCQSIRLPNVFAFDICDGDSIRGVAEGFIGKEPGNYPIEWTFTDQHGNSSIANQQVIITGPPVPEFFVPVSACVGDSVTFIDLSSNVHDQATYLWDFGDSTISTQK